MTDRERMSVTTRVRTHRERLRAQGLRPVQIWVPDVRSPHFAAAAHAQSAAVAAAEADDQDFVDAISWDWAADDSRPRSGEGGAEPP